MPSAAAQVFAFQQDWGPISPTQLRGTRDVSALSAQTGPATLVGSLFSSDLNGTR